MKGRAGQRGCALGVFLSVATLPSRAAVPYSPPQDARTASLPHPHQRSISTLLRFASAKVEYDISACLNIILCVCVGALREPS